MYRLKGMNWVEGGPANGWLLQSWRFLTLGVLCRMRERGNTIHHDSCLRRKSLNRMPINSRVTQANSRPLCQRCFAGLLPLYSFRLPRGHLAAAHMVLDHGAAVRSARFKSHWIWHWVRSWPLLQCPQSVPPPQSLCFLAEANRQTCAVRRTAWWRQTPSNFSMYKPFVYFCREWPENPGRQYEGTGTAEVLRTQQRDCLMKKAEWPFSIGRAVWHPLGDRQHAALFFPALIRPFEVKYMYKLLFCWLGGRCWRWRMKSYKEAKRQAEKWQENA